MNRTFGWNRTSLLWGLFGLMSMLLVSLSACDCGKVPPLPEQPVSDGGGETTQPDITPPDAPPPPPDVIPPCVNSGTRCDNDQQCNPSCNGATMRCFEGRCLGEQPPDVPPDVPPGKCPSKCGSHDDCNVPDCGNRTQCINGTCGFIPPTCPSRCRDDKDCQTPDCGSRILCTAGRCDSPPECPQSCFQDSDCPQIACATKTSCENGACVERRQNTPPIANAGPDDKSTVNSRVQLNGKGSKDAENDPLTFSWRFVSQPPGSLTALDDNTSPTPAFIPDQIGTYVLELIVNDGRESSKPDTVTIVVSQDVNQTPRLVAISPTTIEVGYPTTQLVIFGQNFVASSQLLFQGQPLSSSLLNQTVLTATLPVGLAVGTYTVQVLNGAAGSNILNLQVTKPNNDPPVLTRVDPVEVTAGTAFTLKAFGSKFISGARILFNGAAQTTAFANATELSASIGAQAAGTYKVQVQNPDGQTSATLTILVKTVQAGPIITSINPTEAFAGQAFTLIITGDRFESSSIVTIGGKTYVAVFKSATTLEVAVNIPTAGQYDVEVENANGQTSNRVVLEIKKPLNPPSIASLQPSTVIEKTATSISVLGNDFVTGAKVTINGVSYNTAFISGKQLQVTLPNTLAAGSYKVQVTNPDGKQSNTATLTVTPAPPKPVLSKLTPDRIALGSSGDIIATGQDFVSGAQVQIGARLVNAVFVSATQLTFKLPSGAQVGTFQVRVFNPDNQASNSLPLTIFRGPPPVLTSLKPDKGASGALVTVQLLGADIVDGAIAYFQGGQQTTNFISTTEVRMTLSLGSLSAGTYDVWLQNPDGQNSNKLKFTVTAPTGPQIKQLLPNEGQAGTVVSGIVDGAGFLNGATVQLDGQNYQTTFLSTSTLGIDFDLTNVKAGTYPVTVTNPGGQKSNIFYFTVKDKQLPAPILTTVNPSNIKLGSNKPIYLLGQHFQNGAVMFIQLPFIGGFGMPANYINSTTLVVTAQFPRIPFPFPAQNTNVLVRNPDKQESNKKPVTIAP